MSKFALLLFRVFPHGGLQTDFLRILEECLRRGHVVFLPPTEGGSAKFSSPGLPMLCTGNCGYAWIVRAAGGMVVDEPFRQTEWNQALADFLATLDERRKHAVEYARKADFFRRAQVVVDEKERLCKS